MEEESAFLFACLHSLLLASSPTLLLPHSFTDIRTQLWAFTMEQRPVVLQELLDLQGQRGIAEESGSWTELLISIV